MYHSPLLRPHVFAYSGLRVILEVGQSQSSNIALLQYFVGYLESFTSLYKSYKNIGNNHMTTYLDLDSYSTDFVSQMVKHWHLDIIEFLVHEHGITYYILFWPFFIFLVVYVFSRTFLYVWEFSFGCINVSNTVIVLIFQILLGCCWNTWSWLNLTLYFQIILHRLLSVWQKGDLNMGLMFIDLCVWPLYYSAFVAISLSICCISKGQSYYPVVLAVHLCYLHTCYGYSFQL